MVRVAVAVYLLVGFASGIIVTILQKQKVTLRDVLVCLIISPLAPILIGIGGAESITLWSKK